MEQMIRIFFDLLQMPYVRIGFILAGSIVAALFARLVVMEQKDQDVSRPEPVNKL